MLILNDQDALNDSNKFKNIHVWCVLDSGHGVTTCVPIIDGYSLPHAITRMNIGGNDVTEYFSKILSKCGDYKFNTSSELETVRIIKEKECTLEDFSVDPMQNPNYHSTGIRGIGSNTSNSLLGKLSGLDSNLIGLVSKSQSSFTII